MTAATTASQLLEAELIGEREVIEKDRERPHPAGTAARGRAGRSSEAEGAKETDLQARQRAAEKDLCAIREEYEQELDLLQRTFDEFRDLFPRKIIEDEMLWRELSDRYGEYFEGGMGADAIKSLLDRIDLDEEGDKLGRRSIRRRVSGPCRPASRRPSSA